MIPTPWFSYLPATISALPRLRKRVARDAAVIEAGLDFSIKSNLSVGASYVRQFGDGTQSNGIRLSITRRF